MLENQYLFNLLIVAVLLAIGCCMFVFYRTLVLIQDSLQDIFDQGEDNINVIKSRLQGLIDVVRFVGKQSAKAPEKVELSQKQLHSIVTCKACQNLAYGVITGYTPHTCIINENK